MHLRHGELKHLTTAKPSDDKKMDSGAGMHVALRVLPNWCQYPPPRLIGGGQLVYKQKDAESLFSSLPLMRKFIGAIVACGYFEA
jgi:hypothetical protein